MNGRFNFLALHQPGGGHVQYGGQHFANGPAGNGFTVRILTDLAFSKPHPPFARQPDKIGLLEALGRHSPDEAIGERFILHAHKRSKVQFLSSIN
ncbi:hypothetical protein [Gordonibacter sp. An230]|uniref:hypothetical protein n=1 Tax=Gordonibacter sp. An230 TaxID=1965592 RepID=UPI0019517670|nr:hypothetical protein [Gordonibacter sp. An230]